MSKKQRLALMRKHWGKHTPDEIAELLGVSLRTIWRYKSELGLPGFTPETAEAIVDDYKVKRKLTAERRRTRELAKKAEALQEEIKAALDIKRFRSEYKIPHSESVGGSRAVAVALISDWHIEALVRSYEVNGINKFNEEICHERIRRYFQHLVQLIKLNQQHTKIETLVLWLGGDIVENDIHEQDSVESCRLLPMEAIKEAKRHIVSGIKFILEHTDVNLVIPTSVGNHSRVTKKVFYATEHGHSLEYMMYSDIQDRFEDEPRVTVMVNKGYHTYLQVWPNFTIRFHHGHAIRGGSNVGGIHIPIRKSVMLWNRLRKVELDCMGHFHQFICGGWGGDDYMVNGSLIGYNAFALRIKASPEPPQQAFFLIDERVGKTVVCPIILVEDR